MIRRKDSLDVVFSFMAGLGDALAVFGGIMLAVWIRFHAGLPLPFGHDPDLLYKYSRGALVALLAFLFVFRSLKLYVRPQLGRFESKVPRIARACGISLVACSVMAFAVKNFVTYSTLVLVISYGTVTLAVLLERYILFRLELHYARHSNAMNRVLILGTDEVAAHLMRGLVKDPKRRTEVVGFLHVDVSTPSKEIPHEFVLGTVDELQDVVDDIRPVDQIILANSKPGHQRIVDIILFCEQNLIRFNMVPDLFSVLTGSMDVYAIDDIPLLGVSEWPLDRFWNRVIKRMEDVAVAMVGLIVATPVLALAAMLIKRSSPGPVFYRQERCGEGGRVFTLFKLRTMKADAEAESGPVWARENDPRRTRIGAWLRSANLDELPQLWNVLRGEMSIVGPRPERPHFVEKFKTDIGKYMWRHVSKPGLTGWAQVNGLRGNTSIEERIKYDLYYLENWSLSFDFKIMLRTLFARENAY